MTRTPMCDCSPHQLIEAKTPRRLEHEDRPFWTYSLKYCNNPRRHIFGTQPCCAGLKVTKGGVDPRDFLSLPPLDSPLIPFIRHYLAGTV